MNHTGANRLKVRGRSCWKGFTVIFDIWSSASWRSSYPLSCHRCHIFSLHIPKADCSFLFLFFFFASLDCERQWEQSQKYHYTEGDIRGAGPSDGELWRSSLISELPRRDKGSLKSQETEQSKSGHIPRKAARHRNTTWSRTLLRLNIWWKLWLWQASAVNYY